MLMIKILLKCSSHSVEGVQGGFSPHSGTRKCAWTRRCSHPWDGKSRIGCLKASPLRPSGQSSCTGMYPTNCDFNHPFCFFRGIFQTSSCIIWHWFFYEHWGSCCLTATPSWQSAPSAGLCILDVRCSRSFSKSSFIPLQLASAQPLLFTSQSYELSALCSLSSSLTMINLLLPYERPLSPEYLWHFFHRPHARCGRHAKRDVRHQSVH